ncbi:lactoylglutathione lyase [Rhizobium sp. R72]|uniref:VOC family protein n=1 Tax=unclassified Rhizobium TaxID=2613769 RepID=UPI000B535C6B|nr:MULTISPECIES: VOC family protein [unclassified Rhizobium]OWV94379.1 lactoylglutathione lyase [Rhizobium sp. R72]OWV94649.1 lactoylglutathione lyase [Rhizobium sp. R711]OWV99144.1 lactoylglutathione lyase [Rhizobium sp. R693]
MSEAHPLDHIVLPVSNIVLARERLGKLGFTVAPDARHPFGTENACIFFADETYLEPLAVASAEPYEASAKKGNVFTARDRAFRFRCGDDGFSAAVFATADADRDHARFLAEKINGGEMLQFERPMRLPDGSQATAAFKLAFAVDLRAPDFFFFTCQRVNPLPSDRRTLQTHVNGVKGIAEIILGARDPKAFAPFVRAAAHSLTVTNEAFGASVTTPNAKVSVLSPDGLDAYFDIPAPSNDRGLRGVAIVFTVSDLAVTEAHLAANGMTYTRKNNRILVKAAPGQGALFAFEEKR